jgi:hypothetical protein
MFSRPRHEHLEALHTVERRLISPDEPDKVPRRHRTAATGRKGGEQRPWTIAHDRSPPPAHIVKQVQGDAHPISLKGAQSLTAAVEGVVLRG